MCAFMSCAWQNTVDLATLRDQAAVIQDLRSRMQQQTSDFRTAQMQLCFLHETHVPKERATQLEAKIRELEGKMLFEVATRTRAEVCIITSISNVSLLVLGLALKATFCGLELGIDRT